MKLSTCVCVCVSHECVCVCVYSTLLQKSYMLCYLCKLVFYDAVAYFNTFIQIIGHVHSSDAKFCLFWITLENEAAVLLL